MSRHDKADVIRRGYEDRKAGRVDPVLYSAGNDSLEAQLYRIGVRERGRDEFDGAERSEPVAAPLPGPHDIHSPTGEPMIIPPVKAPKRSARKPKPDGDEQQTAFL